MVHLNFAVNQDVKTEGGMIDGVVSGVVHDARELLIQCARPTEHSRIMRGLVGYNLACPLFNSEPSRSRAIILTEKEKKVTVSQWIGLIIKKVTRLETYNRSRGPRTR